MDKEKKKEYVNHLKGIREKLGKCYKVELDEDDIAILDKLLLTEIEINWLDTLERGD